MKRKVFSVLFALVLVLSLTLVTAVPVGAQVGSFTLGIGAYGGAEPASIVEWSTVQKHSGNYAVHLYSGIKTGQGDEARIVIDPASVGITDLDSINSIAWWRYALAGYPAHIDITLDVDGDGVVDLEDVLSAEMAYNNPFWAPEVGPGVGPTLWEDGGHIGDSYGDWFQTFETTEGDGFGAVNADTLLWVAKMGSGYGTAPSGTLAQWKAGTVGNDPDNEIDDNVITGAATVVKLEIEIDNWVFQAETYVDDIIVNTTTYELELPLTRPLTVDDDRVENPDAYFQTIQGAIDVAVAGETISVYAGTYDEETFPITVNTANLTIQSVAGADTTIIDSVSAGRVIATSAAGVTIGGADKGFTIEGEGAVANGLIYIGANDATITDNRFIGDYYLMVLGPGVSGAMVEDNVFLTYLAITANEVTGIYVNNDVTGSTFDGNHFPLGSDPTRYVDSGIYMATGTTADQTITISNNTFEGMGKRMVGPDYMGCGAIELAGVGGITIENNTIVNCNDGIWFQGAALTGDVTIQNNTITGNVWGIEVKDGVGSTGTITANYNNLAGSTTQHGLLNLETAVTVDARYNWWGAATGPDDDGNKNPYHAQAATAGASKVSTYVTFIPWLIRFDLVVDFEGWNIVSLPIWAEEEEEPSPEPEEIVNIYYFDSSTQYWGADPYEAGPLDAYYIQVTAPISFIYPVSSEVTFPSQKEMKVGWNFVGLAELYPRAVDEALLDAFYGTGAADLVGYSKVISPSLNGVFWTHIREGALQDMIPTKGYWVFMVNDGVLGGFTSTPIVELP